MQTYLEDAHKEHSLQLPFLVALSVSGLLQHFKRKENEAPRKKASRKWTWKEIFDHNVMAWNLIYSEVLIIRLLLHIRQRHFTIKCHKCLWFGFLDMTWKCIRFELRNFLEQFSLTFIFIYFSTNPQPPPLPLLNTPKSPSTDGEGIFMFMQTL